MLPVRTWPMGGSSYMAHDGLPDLAQLSFPHIVYSSPLPTLLRLSGFSVLRN